LTTSSAGQTYTAILFDALNFSLGDVASFGPKYMEFTIADTSNKNDMVIASSNTRLDGPLTLGATVAQNYTAGISNAAAAKLYRSSMSWSQAGLIGFNTALTSGTIATTEEIRLTRLLRESLSGNYGAYVDMFTPQIYKVTAVGGSTIDVADSEDHHLNLLNGDSIHIFSTSYAAGEPNFTLLATRALTANSTASSGTTTLTMTTTSINVGDYVVKQHLTVSASVVSSTANESFATMSYDTTPNGAQLIGSRSYPNAGSVYAHWWLGGPSDTQALLDRSGNGRSLSKVGSPNLQDTFKAGKFALSSMSTSAYLRTAGTTGVSYDGAGEIIQLSFWFYFDAVSGSARALVSTFGFNSSSSKGWFISLEASASALRLAHCNGAQVNIDSGVTLTTGTWNHVVAQIQSGTTQKLFVNGVASSNGTGTINNTDSGQALYFGARSASNTGTLDGGMDLGATGLKIADCIVWRDGPLLQTQDVLALYNGGIPQWIGYQPAVVRNEYSVTGQSGQRISMKAKLARSTTAVSPYILQAGMIKTG
jgi:hypothetical protein